MDIKMNLSKYSDQPISTQVLLGLLKGYSRPYDKIIEMVNQGIIYQLRRGLYITTPLVNKTNPEPFLIANHLYGPSYVSLDSALFYWGLIPEQVYEITSVTTKPSKKFQPLKTTYSFTHMPIAYYPLGLQSFSMTEKQTVLIASPEKSLCDKVIATSGVNLRSKKQAIIFLVEDLRISKDRLRDLNLREMVKWVSVCPKRNSIQILIEAIEEL
jgi:hypothetical protein